MAARRPRAGRWTRRQFLETTAGAALVGYLLEACAPTTPAVPAGPTTAAAATAAPPGASTTAPPPPPPSRPPPLQPPLHPLPTNPPRPQARLAARRSSPSASPTPSW